MKSSRVKWTTNLRFKFILSSSRFQLNRHHLLRVILRGIFFLFFFGYTKISRVFSSTLHLPLGWIEEHREWIFKRFTLTKSPSVWSDESSCTACWISSVRTREWLNVLRQSWISDTSSNISSSQQSVDGWTKRWATTNLCHWVLPVLCKQSAVDDEAWVRLRSLFFFSPFNDDWRA